MMPFSDILKLSLSFRSIDISMAKELPAPVGEGLGWGQYSEFLAAERDYRPHP
jgi:hypothetical protein